MNKLLNVALGSTIMIAAISQSHAIRMVTKINSKLTVDSPMELTKDSAIAMSTDAGKESTLQLNHESDIKGRIEGTTDSKVLIQDGQVMIVHSGIERKLALAGTAPFDLPNGAVTYSTATGQGTFISESIELFSHDEGVQKDEITKTNVTDYIRCKGGSIWEAEHNEAGNAIVFDGKDSTGNKLVTLGVMNGSNIRPPTTSNVEMKASIVTQLVPVTVKKNGSGIVAFSGDNSKASAVIQGGAMLKDPKAMFGRVKFETDSVLELEGTDGKEYTLNKWNFVDTSSPTYVGRGQVIARATVNILGGRLSAG